ncbi:MAG: phosphoserine phosphatase SerB, partial [Pseudoalteromonas marina]
MSNANMAQHSAEQPLSQLTLNKWFSYQKGVFAPLNTTPNRNQGLFSIAF